MTCKTLTAFFIMTGVEIKESREKPRRGGEIGE
jgi:hypothetical protein